MAACTQIVSFVSLFVCVLFVNHFAGAQLGRTRCYDRQGRAQRCVPPFVNAAFNMPVEATNSCGMRKEPTRFCQQTGVTGARKYCDYCDAADPFKSHPPKYLTDFNDQNNLTYWQSETMLEDLQHPNSVNLTLRLGKSFAVTYVRLKFRSSRPESFAIYKMTGSGGEWIPWQYYSGSCGLTYNRRPDEIITRADETKAICIKEFSDISPLTGGSVAFSTLEGRPSAFNFESSEILQEWVTATDIMIVMNRMNTFGDEVFGDPKVLQSYFYAITDFAVGGRCECNGHASECVKSTGQGLRDQLVCRCEHNTMGANCDECQPFYNDRPWGRASGNDAHECKVCNCNGRSERCVFDEELYKRSGHGGRCLDCREDTEGVSCEKCQINFYRESASDRCKACNCNPTGSEDLQCDSTGRCRCKPGVAGDKCDRCAPNYFDFGPNGCRPCACVTAGSLGNDPRCLPNTGVCTCKEFVEGINCDRCKPGYFGLDIDNQLGCQACFCYGHSSVCSKSAGYYPVGIESTFDRNRQLWTASDRSHSSMEVSYRAVTQNIGVQAPGRVIVYFSAPAKYLGDQRFSYNQRLRFTLAIGEPSARASVEDIVIEGNGMKIATHIFAQRNPLPRTLKEEFSFRLHEHADYQWLPKLSATNYVKLLSNISSIKIRGTYAEDGVGFIDDVTLESAERRAPIENGDDEEVGNIERCTCPQGYIGQFCESCAPGYHRETVNGGAYSKCVPCNCNGHSDTCDPDTGRCVCEHNTVGDNCEKCATGYYGYALRGQPDDCTKCPCPDDGACVEISEGEVACLNCREGYTGNLCDQCSDGYFGDPKGENGDPTPCLKCSCNDNIDPNAVLNCDSVTGECLKCIYSTGGFSCDRCLPGYYGDALALPKGQCKPCNCYPPGSDRPVTGPITCAMNSGQCTCQPNVIGRQCDSCREGTWNIDSGEGCESCGCNSIGSYNASCNIRTGYCHCKPGIGGEKCDKCFENHYGFSEEGCKPCHCDPDGSNSLQCDEFTGQCNCKENIVGDKCNRCDENKYNISAGCVECPACYSLVEQRVNIHRRKVDELRVLIRDIGKNPGAINDTDFRKKLAQVNDTVVDLLNDARKAVGSEGPIGQQVERLREKLETIYRTLVTINVMVQSTKNVSKASQSDLNMVEAQFKWADEEIVRVEKYLQEEGYEALRRAMEAQRRFGQQSARMTEIARLARSAADRHAEEASNIEGVANEALNTSNRAYDIANEALNMDTSTQIERITIDIQSAELTYNRTKELADLAAERSDSAYKESLDLFSQVSDLETPKVDVPGLITSAEEISTEAGQVKEEANRLIQEHEELLHSVNSEREEAERLLQEGGRQQNVADELLGDVDAARGMAIDAVQMGNDVVKNAQETKKTLDEFDRQVNMSRIEAEKALKLIPGIKQKIADAERKTTEARDNLAGAEQDAIAAKENSVQAQQTAEMASEDAGKVREEASTAKERAVRLKSDAQSLSSNADEVEKRIAAMEAKATEDEKLIKEANSKAGQAKTSAMSSTEKVQEGLTMMDDIINRLSTTGSVDLSAIDKLETDLNKAQMDIEESGLNNQYMVLAERHSSQQKMMQGFQIDLEMLRKDVQNIREIEAALPKNCSSQEKLEPTSPVGLY